MAYIPMNPPISYLTLTLRDLGFDVLRSNLMTIVCPPLQQGLDLGVIVLTI